MGTHGRLGMSSGVLQLQGEHDVLRLIARHAEIRTTVWLARAPPKELPTLRRHLRLEHGERRVAEELLSDAHLTINALAQQLQRAQRQAECAAQDNARLREQFDDYRCELQDASADWRAAVERESDAALKAQRAAAAAAAREQKREHTLLLGAVVERAEAAKAATVRAKEDAADQAQRKAAAEAKAIAEPPKSKFFEAGHFSAGVDQVIIELLCCGVARNKLPQLFVIFARFYGILIPHQAWRDVLHNFRRTTYLSPLCVRGQRPAHTGRCHSHFRVTDPGLSRNRRAKRPRMDETPPGVEAEDAEGRAAACTSYGGQRVVARREPRTVAEQGCACDQGRGCVRPVRARVAVADGRARLWLSLLCPEVRFLKVCVRVSCGSRGRFSFGRVTSDPMRLPDDATRISGASESCVSQ